MKRIALAFASLTLAGGLAIAQTPEKIAEHWFKQGTTSYNLGRFDEAVAHFTKAYEAWPQPEFLYNIAQSYRLGGNCKQALHFYKRFRSLKEDLSAKKRQEIDRFIKELTECAAKADSTATAQPDTIVKPPPSGAPTTPRTTTSPAATTPPPPPPTTTTATTTTSTPPATVTTTTTTPATATPSPATPATTTAPPKETAALEKPGELEETTSVAATATPAGPTLLSARMMGGVALLGSGDLEIPVQPSVGITGGYPLALGTLTLELGAGIAWTPLPYENAEGQQQGTMLGVRAVAAAVYPVAPAINLRGELGAGIVSLSGLADGNPISSMRQAQSFTLPSVRVGVAAEYAITPNIAAYVSPFGFAFSPGNDDMYGGSLSEIDVLVGVGYRQ